MTTKIDSNTKLSFDVREAKKFLDALCGADCRKESFAWQTFADDKTEKSNNLVDTWSGPFSRETAAKLERLNGQGAGIFVTVNKCNGRGRKKENVMAVRKVFVDLDGAPIEPVREWWIEPYMIVETSPKRYHAYWRIDDSVTQEHFDWIQTKLAVRFNGDQSMNDLNQVMRIAGGWHQKGEPFQARIIHLNDRAPSHDVTTWDIALLDVEVPEAKQNKPKGERKPKERCRNPQEWVNQEALHRIADWAPHFFPAGSWMSGAWRIKSVELGRPCQEDLSIHPDGIQDFGTQWDDRPADTYTATGLLQAFFTKAKGSEPELVTEFDEHGSPIGGSLNPKQAAVLLAEALGEDWTALQEEFSQLWSKGFEDCEAPDPELLEKIKKTADEKAGRPALPEIIIAGGSLATNATEGEDALIAARVPIYVHAEELQRPIVAEVEASKGRRTNVARFAAVTTDSMRDSLAQVADWRKWNERKGKYVAADPPRDVAAILLSRRGEWRFPVASGVITTPTLRPDGSILSTEGYDPATRLLLVSPPPMPEIPAKPSKDDAAKALRLLDALLDEFAFVDEASRSVALSELIAPVVRGALAVSPMHANRAPAPASGKSFLIDTASAICIGKPCPVLSAGFDEHELEKRLGASLLTGQPLVAIDNLNGELRGDFLCQLIERPLVNVRPLGSSDMISIENRATVLATGNNLVLVGDVVRRVVLCSLDPRMERPELRKYKGEPVQAVLGDRGAYIAAALIVVRAYLAAGCPGELPALASFEDWSRLVRSALVWLGQADPVDTMEAARGEDPVLESLRKVFESWHAAVGPSQISAGGLIELADKRDPKRGSRLHPDLHIAMMEVAATGGVLKSDKLGRWLKRYQGRIVSGLRLISTYDTHAKANTWRVAPR